MKRVWGTPEINAGALPPNYLAVVLSRKAAMLRAAMSHGIYSFTEVLEP